MSNVVWNIPNYPIPILKKFWSYISLPQDLYNDEWIWNGTVNEGGYGVFFYNYTRTMAHRLMYSCYYGSFDDSLFVCHKCDNPPCVNPNHLFLGTPKDNSVDMSIKGRSPRGSKSGTSKLHENDVLKILKDISLNRYSTILEITNNYNIQSMQIIRILQGKSWKHITKNFDLNQLKNILKIQQNRGSNNPRAILSDSDVVDIKIRLKRGEKGSHIAKLYGIYKGRVSDIKNGKQWAHITI